MALLAFDSRPPRAGCLAPFEMAGDPDRPACLLLHGLGCSPHTMQELGEFLSALGFHCYAPLLPGHGEELEDFKAVQLKDWVEAAHLSMDYLRNLRSKVVVVGFSLGGTLALELASTKPVAALACLAAPVFLDDWANRIYSETKEVTSALPLVFDVANRAARQRRKSAVHKVLPVTVVGEFLKLQEQVRETLEDIHCPVLVAQSRSDHSVPPSNAPYILRQVGSQKRRLIWLKRAYHVLPVDYGSRRLAREVGRFLLEATGPYPA